LAEARDAHDAAAEAEALRGMGTVLYKQARYEEARVQLLAALQLYEALADHASAGWTLHDLGRVARAQETGAAADAYWARGLTEMIAAGDRHGEARLLYERASVIRSHQEKTAALQRVLQFAREIGDAHTEGLALFGIGDEQFWDGRYATALQTLQEALDRFERAGARESVAPVLVELGRFYENHGKPERARLFYQRAISMLQRSGEKEGLAQAFGAVSNLHRAARQLRLAARAAERALALRMEMGSARLINIERIRLAHLHIALGEHGRAKALLEDVMQTTDTFSRNLAYDPLAEVYLALGRFEEAREAADLAARLTREPAERPFMLANRARADEKLGDSRQALADVDEALQVVEQSRAQLVRTDAMKQGYGERLQRLFDFAIDLRVRLGRPEAGLEAAEQARARAFLDLLATRRAHLESAKDLTPSASVTSVGTDALQSAASATPASLDDLAQIARRLDSTIVSYWVGRTTTIVWVVDREGKLNAATVPVSSRRLASLIGQTSAEIGRASSRGDALVAEGRKPIHAWRELHDLLIRPVLQFLPRARGSLLTIVPHGPLFRLSFAALVDAGGTYLIERYAVHYVPSGGSLLYLRPRQTTADSPARYLLVADPGGSAAIAQLPPLPGAAREVAAIRKVLPPGTTDVLTGARASESGVRRLVGHHAVIHLATHGLLRDDRPFASFLAFGGRGRDPATDGRLTTADIYDLELDAELVVLSACRSAQGPVTGDGVLGMTRAFMYAGAPSVIATLWDVADQTGAELMPAFYRSWRRGHAKSVALRDAQLELLRRLRAGRVLLATPGGDRPLRDHPFFWAGFVLLGEP
jgi:CHAT domain-containing protein/Tfp pilus assembly protein PilF